MQVVHNKDNGTFDCSCLYYHHYRLLCRHIFCVLKNQSIEEIPLQYIVKRWQKDLISSEMLKKRHWDGEGNERRDKLENDAQAAFDYCLGLVVNDMEKLEGFVSKMVELKSNLEANGCSVSRCNTEEMMESLLGVSKSDNIDVRNPKPIRNKGCGTGKRLKSGKEIAIEKIEKAKRKCRLCKEWGNHDSRNFPSKK